MSNVLQRAQSAFQLQVPLPVEYKGVRLECGYRIDVLVEQQLILELKAVDEIKGIHAAQLLTYLNAHSNGSIDQLQRQGIEGRH